MDKIITEKDYPIRNLWLFKNVLIQYILLLIALIFIFIPGSPGKVLFSSGNSLPVFLLVILFI